MRKMLLSLVVGCCAFSARAAEDKPAPEDRFKQLDKDANGQLSLEEFTSKRTGEKAEAAKKQFTKLDANKDNFVSLEEFKSRGKKEKEGKE